MTHPLQDAEFVRLLDERLNEVAEDRYKDLPTMIPRVARMLKTDGAWYEAYEIGSVPDIPIFNGALTPITITPQYHVKIEPKEYGAYLSFQRKLIDDKRYSVLENQVAGLMNAANRVREKKEARIFQYATSAAFDYMHSEENLSLANNSHTTRTTGVSTSSGFDNLGTSALTKTAVAATRIAMKGFKNDIGERIDVGDDLSLIVPTNLADTAEEIVGTIKGLDTGDGNINPQYGRYKIIEYPRLDDVDTNNWAMVWESQMKQDNIWIDRIMPEINNHADFFTLQLNTSMYFRCAAGFLGWRWIYYQNVS